MSPALTCPKCGERIQPSVGECLFCSGEAGWEPSPPPAGAARPDDDAFLTPADASPPDDRPTTAKAGAAPMDETPSDADRAFGLLLFEAEEQLARGQGEKAVVLASKAVRDRPESVTARALYERARRELLRGRRREKLEARIQEAQALFEIGNHADAERIVTSALKFLPDHAVALRLLAFLKERRASLGTVEAEAEGELELLAQVQARHALGAARKALAAGWDRRAMVAVRRGLRLVPGEPELLKLLKDLQLTGDLSDVEAARRRALAAQIREATERLGEGRLEESLKILRAVLKEDPENARAQAAVQQVRRAWLRRGETEGMRASEPMPAPTPGPASTPAPRPLVVDGPHSSAPASAPETPRAPSVTRPRVPPSPAPPAGEAKGTKAIPPEILLPRSRRRATPLGLVLLSAALFVGLLFFLTSRTSGPPSSPPAPSGTTLAPARTEPPPETAPSGPLARLSTELRQEIERTLGLYSQALESQNGDLLARVRPDLSPSERRELLAPFVGALNVATDLRVLEVMETADTAVVTLLRTDVIVGGKQGSRPPAEETLRFVHGQDGWSLRAKAAQP